MQEGKKQKCGSLEIATEQQTKKQQKGNLHRSGYLHWGSFAGGFPSSGQKIVLMRQNFVYWIWNE